ncbi:MAG: hypothetical protein AAF616_06190 [Bacteroidota bacterium]
MRFTLLFTVFFAATHSCKSQVPQDAEQVIIYTINGNVKNEDEAYFTQINDQWQTYLNAGNYLQSEGVYWDRDQYNYPEIGYLSLLMYLRNLRNAGGQIQCSILGIVPVKEEYFMLKAAFLERNVQRKDLADIKFIISIYAKKKDGECRFYSTTEYHRMICKSERITNVNYVIHPDHDFSNEEAMQMEEFNDRMADLFSIPPLQFDYVVANNTRDLSDMFGVHLFEYSYEPVASGGMADTYNNIIYAGNNSAYYPHEVVHLYTSARFRGRYHHWVDEGIAALLGGSTGYKIEWHWEKLRRFLSQNPDFSMQSLTELQTYIPNGAYTTDFRYAIGSLICQKIIEKEGMQGIFAALQAGREEEDYFRIIENKLGVAKSEFEGYIKSEFSKLELISDEELKALRY